MIAQTALMRAGCTLAEARAMSTFEARARLELLYPKKPGQPDAPRRFVSLRRKPKK